MDITPSESAPEHRRPRARRRWVRPVLVSALVVVLAVAAGAAWLINKGNQVSGEVFAKGGGVSGLLRKDPLKQDADGRINILLFGTSQDDVAHSSGEGGQGMWLTDSIQLISVDATTKQAVMVAIPRDTWVTMPANCPVGQRSKVNAVFECAAAGPQGSAGYYPKFFSSLQKDIPNYKEREIAGAAALMKTVGEVTGVVPSYYVHVNYSVLRESVDAVGGITVHIVGDGHDGIFDTNLDYPCPQEKLSCRKVYYPHDGNYTLGGEQALNLARARGDGRSKTNPYACMQFGLDGGEFNRAANQQKILAALKEQAVSAGTLSNPLKLNSLLNALGSNIVTNLTASQGRTAVDLVQSMGELRSISLVDPAHPVLTMGRIGAASVVLPVAGPLNWTGVHEYVRAQTLALEAAPTSTPSATGSRSSAPGKSAKTKPPSTSGTTGSGRGATSTVNGKSTYERPYTCAGIG